MSIEFTRKKTSRFHKPESYASILLALSIFCLSFLCISFTYAASSKSGLSEGQLEEFAQNDILFYDPNECIGGGSTASGICGSNTKEKLWSALRQHFDEVHAAAALGNILHEGGLNPLRWEYKAVNQTNPPTFDNRIDDWNKFYDGTYMKMCYDSGFQSWYCIGVGDFAITSRLDEYLQYIKKTEPDLFDYFKDPKYTYMEGDSLIEELGEDTYDRLIALEVRYFIEEWLDQGVRENFEEYTDVTEAARYYSRAIMACEMCRTDSVMSARAASAVAMYEELKGFNCSGGSSTSSSSSSSSSGTSKSSVSGSDIIWIGDSDSALAHDEEGYDLIERTLPGVGLYAQSGKVIGSGGDDNPSGLAVLEEIVKKGELRPYLVFAMGGNGGWGNDEEEMQKNMDKFLDLIDGKDVKVILTTTKYKTVDYPESNAFVEKIAEENPNIYLADVAANYKNEYFTEDPIEFNAEGGKMFVQTIKDALEQASSGSCTTYEGEYPQYIQWDEPWGGLPYSNGYYSDSACGAASMAMLATVATGQDIFPNDIGDFLEEQATLKKIPGGASPYYDSTSVAVLDPIVGEHYDFEVITDTSSTPEETKTKFRDYLQKGYMIHFTGAGHYPGFYPLQDGSDSKGHVIGLFSIDSEDNVMQANSAFGGNQKVSLDDMANAKIWSDFTAIKGKNSGRNTCNTSNICKDSGTSTGTETSKPIEPIHEDSTDIPCDPRTIDLGIRDDAYYGERYSIRLCAIPNIKFNDMQGPDKELDDQYAHVNSRVSGAFYSLSEENKNTCGNYLEANDDFRTYEEQEDRCRTTNAICATPGSVYANHQGGLAIDFDTSTYCSSLTSGGYLSSEFLSKFGLQNAMDLNEPWHVDPEGSR